MDCLYTQGPKLVEGYRHIRRLKMLLSSRQVQVITRSKHDGDSIHNDYSKSGEFIAAFVKTLGCVSCVMENYTKGETGEVEMAPVFSLADSAVEMKVNANSKIRNLLGYSMKKIKEPEVRQMTWNASGNAIAKAISCVEIMKRKVKGLSQVTKLRYRRIEECWEPKLEGLDRLKVNRDIPAICILLSKDPVDTSDDGYQAPGVFDAFWKSVGQDTSIGTSSPSNSTFYKPRQHKRSHKGTKRKMPDSAKSDSSCTVKSTQQLS